ncbi:MAG: methyltransferase [Rhizobiaceae bacterium]|nr:methyltransferase [Rhizobiaceae bacterium]
MTRLSIASGRAFILENTSLIAPPHVPELRLHLADEAHDLWHRAEEELAAIGLPPPFWAFAWAGGQGLARHVLDNPGHVANRSVLDFATGSGLVAIAASRAGASTVLAADIDPFCEAAVELNAEANGLRVTFAGDDLIDSDLGWDVVLAGDVFYEKPFAERLVGWFERLRLRGADIYVGDPGRSYLPRDRLEMIAVYEVPVTRALEDADVKKTTVWRFA